MNEAYATRAVTAANQWIVALSLTRPAEAAIGDLFWAILHRSAFTPSGILLRDLVRLVVKVTFDLLKFEEIFIVDGLVVAMLDNFASLTATLLVNLHSLLNYVDLLDRELNAA